MDSKTVELSVNKELLDKVIGALNNFKVVLDKCVDKGSILKNLDEASVLNEGLKSLAMLVSTVQKEFNKKEEKKILL